MQPLFQCGHPRLCPAERDLEPALVIAYFEAGGTITRVDTALRMIDRERAAGPVDEEECEALRAQRRLTIPFVKDVLQSG